MHDIRFIRDHPDIFDRGLQRRGLPARAKEILEIDKRRRLAISESESLQAQRKSLSQQIGMAKRKGEPADALMAKVVSLEESLKKGERDAARLDEELKRQLDQLPNIPADDVPTGSDEHSNVESRRIGSQRNFSFPPKDHVELGEATGEMDFVQAVKISGSRFVILKRYLARLERALAQFMLDLHTSEEGGYTEINPPLLVKNDAVYGVGQLPKFKDDLFQATFTDHDAMEKILQDKKNNIPQYTQNAFKAEFLSKYLRNYLVHGNVEPMKQEAALKRVRQYFVANNASVATTVFSDLYSAIQGQQTRTEKRWLIPTAEVPLTNLVSDSILEEKDLPLRYTAWTPSFRSEAGAAGKDTRGMIRQHQFFKVELVSITTPEQSEGEHERMTGRAEEVLKQLGLAYRVMTLCSGDMGFSARKTYDLEVWLPGQNAYREISSCSNCGDFQARRMNARYRPRGGKGTRFLHTLNGSALAVGRTLVAVLENYQNEDGSVTVPEALRSYMGGLELIPAPRAMPAKK
ncbi:serine--tRNA ligase [Reyranella aquatilis]|uniref:Serine--tRNA ligase n=1 Tax=Reyranella aquatilis TaxID=2035356 RepID=A0ABS8KV84_9HYPH|nr:serine--tRNA ligase [Reyranella aquatilis]MCC8429977.1 serine--tRNA ligase [Reyranella aquatilis]